MALVKAKLHTCKKEISMTNDDKKRIEETLLSKIKITVQWDGHNSIKNDEQTEEEYDISVRNDPPYAYSVNYLKDELISTKNTFFEVYDDNEANQYDQAIEQIKSISTQIKLYAKDIVEILHGRGIASFDSIQNSKYWDLMADRFTKFNKKKLFVVTPPNWLPLPE